MITYRGEAANTFPYGFPFLADTDFDINGDGVQDYRFLGDPFVAAVQSYGGNRFISVQALFPDLGGSVVPVTAESIIGADTSFLSGDWHSHTDNGGGSGYGLGSGPSPMQFADAYIGVEFMASDGIHYGWIQYVGFSHPEKGLIFPVPGGFIDSWGWETQPGVPIIAGAIPEPSTAAYLGGSAYLLWQRNAHTRRENKALQRTPRGLFVLTFYLIRKWLGFDRAHPRP